MEEKEVFDILGKATIKSVEKINDWVKAILYIKRQEKSVGFESSYINKENQEIEIDTETNYSTAKAVHHLHRITSTHPIEHKKWNKAKFSVTPDNNFEIEYFWDQDWQDNIDRLNSSAE